MLFTLAVTVQKVHAPNVYSYGRFGPPYPTFLYLLPCGLCHGVQELMHWSTHHKLPTSADQYLSPWEAAWKEHSIQAAGWGSLGLGCLEDPPPKASSVGDWLAVASAPNMLQADSMEELASVLGPEGEGMCRAHWHFCVLHATFWHRQLGRAPAHEPQSCNTFNFGKVTEPSATPVTPSHASTGVAYCLAFCFSLQGNSSSGYVFCTSVQPSCPMAQGSLSPCSGLRKGNTLQL
jgi:hypothetical protein